MIETASSTSPSGISGRGLCATLLAFSGLIWNSDCWHLSSLTSSCLSFFSFLSFLAFFSFFSSGLVWKSNCWIISSLSSPSICLSFFSISLPPFFSLHLKSTLVCLLPHLVTSLFWKSMLLWLKFSRKNIQNLKGLGKCAAPEPEIVLSAKLNLFLS